MHLDKLENKAVLLLSPRALDEAWVEHFLPSMKALHISSSVKRLSDLLPVLTSVFFHGIAKSAILFICPVAFCQAQVIGRSLLVFGRATFVKVGLKYLLLQKDLLGQCRLDLQDVMRGGRKPLLGPWF